VFTKQGRRIVNVGVEAWQEDRSRPIARAQVIFLVEPLE
jgi:acyl-coenzyme A thioesterase PaaI-like protein